MFHYTTIRHINDKTWTIDISILDCRKHKWKMSAMFTYFPPFLCEYLNEVSSISDKNSRKIKSILKFKNYTLVKRK